VEIIMALIKNKMTDFEVEAGYWKVDMVSIDRHLKETSFSLNLYLSKDTKKFFESYTVSLLNTEDKTLYNQYFETLTYKDVYTACYEYTKAHEEYFKDAESDE